MRRVRLGTITRELLVAPADPLLSRDRSSLEVPRRGPIAGLGYDLEATLPPFTVWVHHELGAKILSSVDMASEPELCLQWHVSITRLGPTPLVAHDELVREVLTAFEMRIAVERAEEDNHVAHGKARNFWLPVPEHLRGVPCTCKATEIAHRVGAYEWRDPPIEKGSS